MPYSQYRIEGVQTEHYFMRHVAKLLTLLFATLWFLSSPLSLYLPENYTCDGQRFGVFMSFDSLGLNRKSCVQLQSRVTSSQPRSSRRRSRCWKASDLMASAQTGTKTAGFTLPLLELLVKNQPHAGAAVRFGADPRANP
jgi:hypothetical protein